MGTKTKQRKNIRVFQVVEVTAPELPTGLVTVQDAAAFLGVNSETVRSNLANGIIRGQKELGTPGHEGWRWLIPSEELMRVRDLWRPLASRLANVAAGVAN